MGLTIEIEREEDGRGIAEVPQFPGVLAYGQTREEAISNVQSLALRGSPTDSTMARELPTSRCCSRSPYEPVAIHQGKARSGGLARDRLDLETPVGNLASRG